MARMTRSPSRGRSLLAILGVSGVTSILWRYFREKAKEQVRMLWFIVVYLLAFQVLVLRLPLVHSLNIALGLVIVVIGLAFFMEGLRLGLMPFGETIGAILPRNARLSLIAAFAFLLGMGATFAEPAISVLKQAGSGVSPIRTPLLYSMLNDFAGQLVLVVGVGVGLAVVLGVIRFFYGWPLKNFIPPIVLVLAGMTLYAYFDPLLQPIIGLAWDCGAVTTGPVTVPLVLALGIGVCRVVGSQGSGTSGFGIVTLASLFPILAVLLLGVAHRAAGDYYGAANYLGGSSSSGESAPEGSPVKPTPADDSQQAEPIPGFSHDEFLAYQGSRELPEDSGKVVTRYVGGEVSLEDGRIVHRNAEIVIEKREERGSFEEMMRRNAEQPWTTTYDSFRSCSLPWRWQRKPFFRCARSCF